MPQFPDVVAPASSPITAATVDVTSQTFLDVVAQCAASPFSTSIVIYTSVPSAVRIAMAAHNGSLEIANTGVNSHTTESSGDDATTTLSGRNSEDGSAELSDRYTQLYYHRVS